MPDESEKIDNRDGNEGSAELREKFAAKDTPNDFDAVDFIAVDRCADKEARAGTLTANDFDRKGYFRTRDAATDWNFDSLPSSGANLLPGNAQRIFAHVLRPAAFFLALFFLSTIRRSTSITIGPLSASRPRSIR